MPLWCALEGGIKRAVAVWHRRAGKDSVGLNWTVTAAHERIGLYWHLFPTMKQGRRDLWDGMTKEGRPFLDYWPKELIAGEPNNTEMKIRLRNGSMWQVVGAAEYDALRGPNPLGVVISEYAIQDPRAWELIRPILAENQGWAVFLYTPRGRNHAHQLYQTARKSDKWFCELLTAGDTGAISEEVIQTEREGGMSEQMIRQEFWCSFDAPLMGAFYAEQMMAAADEGRITHVPHQPELSVETWWDLGFTDATAIWFVQKAGQEVHCIDYYENSGEGLAHYANMLQDRGKPVAMGGRAYKYGRHVLPFDARAHELGTGKTRVEVLAELGIEVDIAPDLSIADGVAAARNMLARTWFDENRCERGIEALRQHRKEMDEERSDGLTPYYKRRRREDWTSHACDAFRYGAVALKGAPKDFYRKIEYTDRPLI